MVNKLLVIKRPLVTEKGNTLAEKNNQVAFEVDIRSDKNDIKQAVEQLFKVKVDSVRTMIVHGKVKRVGRSVGRRSNWKKAVVQLEAGQKIELFEGV